MSRVALDVEAVRRRFSSLDRSLVFFDGPGGTQAPDEEPKVYENIPRGKPGWEKVWGVPEGTPP